MKLRSKLYLDQSPYENAEILSLDAQGWLGDPIALKNAITAIKPKTIIDVGSWKGCSADFMVKESMQYGNDFEVICIDTWLGSHEHYAWEENYNNYLPRKNNRINLYDVFLSNMMQLGNSDYVTPFRIDSVNGYMILKDWGIVADLIYVDAAHDYNSAKQDILNYKQILRPGGVMVCDDYSWFQGVREAADECIPNGNHIGHKYYWINH